MASVDAPVEHRLEAQYFDTADLRLAGARITLRRRTGGPDDGWHVKLPASGDARRELHSPAGPGHPPSRPRPSSPRSPGVLRGAPTGPVAQLRTRRVVTVLRDADGRPLAEVADDDGERHPAVRPGRHGRGAQLARGRGRAAARATATLLAAAWASGWSPRAPSARRRASKLGPGARRWRSGGPAGSRRRRAGRSAGPRALRRARWCRAALAEQVTALQLADVGLRTGCRRRPAPDADRLPVGCAHPGRLPAVLEREATEPLREELRRLAGRLSEARDDEVAFAALRAAVAELPAELVLGPGGRPAAVGAGGGGASGAATRRSALGRRHLDLLDALHALLADPPLTGRAARAGGPVLDARRAPGGAPGAPAVACRRPLEGPSAPRRCTASAGWPGGRGTPPRPSRRSPASVRARSPGPRSGRSGCWAPCRTWWSPASTAGRSP